MMAKVEFRAKYATFNGKIHQKMYICDKLMLLIVPRYSKCIWGDFRMSPTQKKFFVNFSPFFGDFWGTF